MRTLFLNLVSILQKAVTNRTPERRGFRGRRLFTLSGAVWLVMAAACGGG